jgi:enoyl-CoA hydratase/carnithine racemase
MSDYVKYEQDGHIVTLTLNAPDKRNAPPSRIAMRWSPRSTR